MTRAIIGGETPTTELLEFPVVTNLPDQGNLNTEKETNNQVPKPMENLSKWNTAIKRKHSEGLRRVVANRRRSASLSDSPVTKINKTEGMETIHPEIPTNNRFSLFAECLNIEHNNTIRNTNSYTNDTKPTAEKISTHKSTDTNPRNIKPPPIYIHGNINHVKLLDALNDKYKNAFHVKFTSNNLKIMFENTNHFADFKNICKKENIQYHTYTISTEKTITIVLKGLIKLPVQRISNSNSIKNQGLNPIACTEIPTQTKYPVYRVTFAPGISIAQINHIRYIEHIKVYWAKFESRKPTIQCFRCQAHGHISANCNKKAVCVKCAGNHDTRDCKKTLETPPTCANCKGNHPANYSKCPALLASLAKKKRTHQHYKTNISTVIFPSLAT